MYYLPRHHPADPTPVNLLPGPGAAAGPVLPGGEPRLHGCLRTVTTRARASRGRAARRLRRLARYPAAGALGGRRRADFAAPAVAEEPAGLRGAAGWRLAGPGRRPGYALVAAAAFIAASAAVYFVNDVVDAERDRRHPVKRNRAIASGRLPGRTRWRSRPLCVVAGRGRLPADRRAQLAAGHRRLPGLLAPVHAGAQAHPRGRAAVRGRPASCCARSAARPPPTCRRPAGSCSCAAWARCMVAIAKRYTELAVLGADAAGHRPVMRWYSRALLRLSQRVAAGRHDRGLPAVGLRPARRVDPHPAPGQRAAAGRGPAPVRLADRQAEPARPVEDLIARDTADALLRAQPGWCCSRAAWLDTHGRQHAG